MNLVSGQGVFYGSIILNFLHSRLYDPCVPEKALIDEISVGGFSQFKEPNRLIIFRVRV
jgi:hypothetical protein